MKGRHNPIFKGSATTYEDLFSFGEELADIICKEMFENAKDQLLTENSYLGYCNFLDKLEFDLAALWLRCLWNRNLSRESIKCTYKALNWHFQGFHIQTIIDRSISALEKYSDTIKEYLLQVEAYELIPSLDKKTEIFRTTLIEIKKEFKPQGLPQRLPDGVVKRQNST